MLRLFLIVARMRWLHDLNRFLSLHRKVMKWGLIIGFALTTLGMVALNLRIQGNDVWSYSTIVAKIDGDNLNQLGYWSQTTQKHINYVANQLSLTLIKE